MITALTREILRPIQLCRATQSSRVKKDYASFMIHAVVLSLLSYKGVGVPRQRCPCGNHRSAGRPGIGGSASKTGLDAMPVEITENRGVNREEPDRMKVRSPEEGVSIEHPTTEVQTPAPPHRRSSRRRKLLIGVVGAVILVAAGVMSIPSIRLALNTASTDDAFVNGHVTFVAPRVGGKISRVLVDDNNRVRKGDLLAAIDKEPFEVAVSQKRAAVDTANADLQAATASVRGIESEAMSRRWKLQGAVQDLENQIALLRDRVAALDKSKATLALAQVEFERAKQLLATGTGTRQEYDRRQEGLSTASAQVTQALAEVRQVRASLGLPPQPDHGDDLARCRPISIRPFLPSSKPRQT